MKLPSFRVSTLFAALAAAVLFATPSIAQEKPMPRTVTVTATGEVHAVPDIAHVSLGVGSEAATARDALTANSDTMKTLIEGLKKSGVAAEDIQTSQLSIDPRYTNPQDGKAPTVDGYRVTNQVTITARDLDRLGELLDNLVSLGGNQIGGLSFEVSKAETLKDDARKAAIANARRRAELYAAAAGASVGEVISISEDTATFEPRPMPMARMAASKSVPIERGSQALEARVTVMWALK